MPISHMGTPINCVKATWTEKIQILYVMIQIYQSIKLWIAIEKKNQPKLIDASKLQVALANYVMHIIDLIVYDSRKCCSFQMGHMF